MKTLTLFLLLVVTTSCSRSSADNLVSSPDIQNNNRSPSNNGQVANFKDVSLCDLLKAPANFVERSVRVKAIFRRGFEKSELYSLKCSTPGALWAAGTKTKCKNAGRIDETEYDGGERTVGIVAIGRLLKGQPNPMGDRKSVV